MASRVHICAYTHTHTYTHMYSHLRMLYDVKRISNEVDEARTRSSTHHYIRHALCTEGMYARVSMIATYIYIYNHRSMIDAEDN